jgi:LuxR family maltose regulon positive regulatory protein
MTRHDAPFALFLDDFELITEPAVLSLVREMLDRLPRGGRLVLGSRSLPDLGLGRLRAAGQLLEIETELLRFSLAETQRFFAQRPGTTQGLAGRPDQPELPGAPQPAQQLQEHLAELHRKTEGWIAALWLASMALDAVHNRQGSVADFIAQFSGSNRAVADYLAEDVLARQTPELRDFLLRTSVLRHLNAPLCQLLNPRQDARRILEQLDSANLFITPLSGPREVDADGTGGHERAWRYHSLFADFLRNQLAREQPDELARLHLAASGWFEAQGRPVPAIDHAIEGGDMPHALHLLEQHAMHFLEQGRMRLLARWFAALPAALLRQRPMMQVVALWATTLTRGPWLALEQLQQSGVAANTDPAVQAHVNAMRPMLLAMMDRGAEAHALGREQLARLPSGQAFADRVLGTAMAHVYSTMGQRDQARRLLDRVRSGEQDSGFNRMYSESVEGLLDLQQGRLRQATARFRMAVGATPSGPYQPSNGNAWAGVLYAGAVYEANQLPQAEQLLNVYLPLARDVGLPDHMILSHVMRARIAFLRGDIDATLQTITELEYLGHHRQLPRVVASARLERARVLMLQGQAQAAAQELERADDNAVWARVAQSQLIAHDVDDMAIGRLRWQALLGDAAAAARDTAEAAEAALAAQRHRRAITLRVLQALAEQRAGRPQAAVALMQALLPQATSEGFVRLLLDAGPGMGPLLRRTRQALLERGGGSTDPLQDDHLQHLIRLAPDAADDPGNESGELALGSADSPGAPPALEEPLTRKEVRVLQLLAEGYSNSAMAEKLFVSDSTVRTHLRNINMKLGARSRTQAVAIARRLGVMG